jgi:hypothetical protein
MSHLPDGSPAWLPQCERWLVGAAMLSTTEDVISAAGICTPSDFRDEVLGGIWGALVGLEECPCWVHAARAMPARLLDDIGGEPELVEIAYSQGAYLYANHAGLDAHASLVREWGEKRRKIQSLSSEVRAVYQNNIADQPRPKGRGGVIVP